MFYSCCDVCVNPIDIQTEKGLFQSLKFKFKKCIRMKHTFQKPNFFDIGSIFIDYISHNETFELYLVKKDFTLILDKKFCPHFKSELQLQNSLAECHLQKYLLLWFECFFDKAYIIFDISER